MQYDLSKLANATFGGSEYTTSINLTEAARWEDYYSVRRLSSSDFDLCLAVIYGKKIQMKDANFAPFVWGRAFHTAILEPHKTQESELPIDIKYAVSMFRASEFSSKLSHCLKEVSHYFTCYDLPCKSKMDAIDHRNKTLYDLKTTNCTEIECMIKSIAKYNYDRQMAFYLDALGYERCEIIFYSKQSREFFSVVPTKEMIDFGRYKYKSILKKVRDNNLFNQIIQIKYGA